MTLDPFVYSSIPEGDICCYMDPVTEGVRAPEGRGDSVVYIRAVVNHIQSRSTYDQSIGR